MAKTNNGKLKMEEVWKKQSRIFIHQVAKREKTVRQEEVVKGQGKARDEE